MICLATGPDLLTDPITATATLNPFAPDVEISDEPAEELPLWRSRPIDKLDWPEPTDLAPPSTISRLFWRGIIARWPLDGRQQWGDLANRLQDSGLDWMTAERRAFEFLMEQRSTADR